VEDLLKIHEAVVQVSVLGTVPLSMVLAMKVIQVGCEQANVL